MTEINRKEAVPVEIGSLTLYCERFRATAIIDITEKPTVTGAAIMTNRCKRGTKILLSGRVYNDDNPLDFLSTVGNVTYMTSHNIQYKNALFVQCQINSLVVEDKGDDFTDVTITLSTNKSVIIS